MRDLIFVDTESTGLSDDDNAEIVELSWCTRDSDVETIFFGVTEVPEFIDNLIGFKKRGIAGSLSDYFAFERFLKASHNNTMVAANPAHDKHFIQKAGLWAFHYRMLDIETYAFAKHDAYRDIPSMKNIYDLLSSEGHELTRPDHTSRNDVLALRESFLILENL